MRVGLAFVASAVSVTGAYASVNPSTTAMVAIMIWRFSGSMSGARRASTSTDGSILRSAAQASALLRITAVASSAWMKVGMLAS